MGMYTPEMFMRNEAGRNSIEKIENAIITKEPLAGIVIKCDTELNTLVKLGENIYGEIDSSEFEFHPDGKALKPIEIISKVGKVVKVQVLGEVKQQNSENSEDGKQQTTSNHRVFNISRKNIQEDCYKQDISKLEVGKVIDAFVMSAETYGAFCDIGCGLTALLPVENVCVPRIDNPRMELPKLGKIKAVVKSIKNGKITLTHKELLGTWQQSVSNITVGETVNGVVRVITDFGVFVQIAPNLVGLADIDSSVCCGDYVTVFVRNIIPEKGKVKLSIINKIDSHGDLTKFKIDYIIPDSGYLRTWKYGDCAASRIGELNI